MNIRHRLLETDELTFQTAVNKAELLNRAQKRSVYYAYNSKSVIKLVVCKAGHFRRVCKSALSNTVISS